MWVLLERPDIPGRAGSNVRCPMCRANTMVQDISYVSTIRQLTEQEKDLVVKVINAGRCQHKYQDLEHLYIVAIL